MKIKRQDDDPAHHLYKAIALIENAEEARQFFEDLATPAERQALADRWQVVSEIKKAKPYRKIYDETGVSVTTVGRVARCISMGTGGYNLIYDRQVRTDHENEEET